MALSPRHQDVPAGHSPTAPGRDDHPLGSTVDHLDPRPDLRRDVARVVLDVRANLAGTGDAGQWVFRHLLPLRPGACPWPAVDDLSVTPFLVQPWLDRWRWPEDSASTTGTDPAGEGEHTDQVLGQVAPVDRDPVRELLAGVGTTTATCFLHLGTSAGGRGAPGVMIVRQVGTAAHATIAGVLLRAAAGPATGPDHGRLRTVDTS